MDDTGPYAPRRAARSTFLEARGLAHHVLQWGDAASVSAARPPLVLLHGWMDVAASFQFVMDALADNRFAIALDWRGFGLTDAPQADSYWFPDYLGDLDAVLDALPETAGGRPIDLVGHSMGGNVAMLYAGVRPERIRRLVNLEGFGMPASKAEQAPGRMREWLDSLKEVQSLRTYANLDAVAERLRKTNPLLRPDRAAWLAAHWSRQVTNADGTPGEFEILGDPAHKRPNPILPRVDEWLEFWKRISAPVLWVEGDLSSPETWWGNRYTKEEFHRRLDVVTNAERHVLAPAGHMLHHDRPDELARLLERFLAG
ncbi:alpha/beta fold hydrolase [Piscinibacter koreensis]|uniref:Alpha/beta hydrolase n=1 Tax=Piscinibacter koreensis TaxID=2742824 RepID=A0A7Y6TW05_9BURK|nr:alpha/beta hydrolase [Schlegelella koreensis]NUZ05496.1 alpha/beta hydrolase [Schlegelella koreensis]